MSTRQTPQGCLWATPTLYLPLPDWIAAWDAPWSCRRDEPPRLLACTDECEACPHFVQRAEAGFDWTISQLGM